VSRWFGYRGPTAAPPTKTNYVVWIWSFIGAFGGLSVLQAIFINSEYFLQRRVPPIIASYVSVSKRALIVFAPLTFRLKGASAVLVYGAIESPLAQPRALLGGHFIAALIGVCITKLFSLLHNEQRFDELRWLAGSLSTATAIVVMQITETTHPPAGASALLAAISPDITELGWSVVSRSIPQQTLNRPFRYYLPIILLSSSLILAVALLVNNIQRRYPLFWLAPASPPRKHISPILETPRGEESVIIAEMDKDVTARLPIHSPHLSHMHPPHPLQPVVKKSLGV
jgi:CBS-domain-containing membrane protein